MTETLPQGSDAWITTRLGRVNVRITTPRKPYCVTLRVNPSMTLPIIPVLKLMPD